jgi:hypothetical protein
MTLDWTVSIGTVLHLVGLVVALTAGWYGMKHEIARLHNDAMTKVAAVAAMADKRLTVIEGQVGDLRTWWQQHMERRGSKPRGELEHELRAAKAAVVMQRELLARHGILPHEEPS